MSSQQSGLTSPSYWPHFGPADYTREETYYLTRLPVEYASTLLPEAYTSPEFFEVEQEHVFASGWIAVGHTGQIKQAGDAIVTQVAGQPLIVTRDQQGQLRAFFNVCRHRGAKLLDEDCTRNL
jgi:phenylpropionate dioxygenase-like ring-hydroxylating dioxygenase large terminal subunit